MARPRVSDAPRSKFDRLPDLDTSATRIDLPPPVYAWSAATKREYLSFCDSEAARAIRESETHLLTRYFSIVDKESRLWKQFEDTAEPKAARDVLALVHQCHRMMLSLGRELAIGGLSRRNLGVAPVTKPLSRLAQFQSDGG
jgi:hypothetical protein